MKIVFLIFLLIVTSCKVNKVVKHHGVHYLDKKHEKLIINESNLNDITYLLGPPSTKSTFDNDVLIYIEREISRGKLLKVGKNVLVKNNILILEVDSQGLLVKKEFLDIDDMKNINFSKETTEKPYSKRSFIYDFLSSMRQKINDPLGKRKK